MWSCSTGSNTGRKGQMDSLSATCLGLFLSMSENQIKHRSKRMNSKILKAGSVAAIVTFGALAAGCASTGDLESVKSQATDAQQSAEQAMQTAQQANETAMEAKRMAA